MKELSLNILDVAKNSVKACATQIHINLEETENRLVLTITDNGCGMSREQVANVTDPFFTTRTTRSVGMGIPLLKLAAEQTGGSFEITSSDSPDDHGTQLSAWFYTDHIDFTPLGDIISTLTALIGGSPDIDWFFTHSAPGGTVELSTPELREVLGDVPLDNYEVLKWIEEYLREGYNSIHNQ